MTRRDEQTTATGYGGALSPPSLPASESWSAAMKLAGLSRHLSSISDLEPWLFQPARVYVLLLLYIFRPPAVRTTRDSISQKNPWT